MRSLEDIKLILLAVCAVLAATVAVCAYFNYLASAIVIGGAGAFGADSLNEQIVQGLWAAEQIA